MQFLTPKNRLVTVESILIYLFLSISAFSLLFLGLNREPYPLALAYAALSAGASAFFCAALLTVCGIATKSFAGFFTYAVCGVFLALVFTLYRKLKRPVKTEGLLYCAACVGLFVGIFPWNSYVLHEALSSPLYQKLLFGGIILIFCPIFSIALHSLVYKALKCRLCTHEMIFICFTLVLIGTGLYQCAGANIYRQIAIFVLLIFCATVKSSSVFACALILSVPEVLASSSLLHCSHLLFFSCCAYLFLSSGRAASAFGVFLAQTLIAALTGKLSSPLPALLVTLANFAIPSVAFLLVPSFVFHSLSERLVFYREKQLSRIAINSNRAAIGEKLFGISALFQEINASFLMLASVDDSLPNAQKFILDSLRERVCAQCEKAESCSCLYAENGISRLNSVGCAKGKVAPSDLPQGMKPCICKESILHHLNKLLAAYRTQMIEAQNAEEGRKLLALQAEGVSEVLKNLALSQSEPLRRYGEEEKRLKRALAKKGIVCSEILLYGENDAITVSLVLCNNHRGETVEKTVALTLGFEVTLAEKIEIGGNRFCYILHPRPKFDAAFGIASRNKDGETVSGDTHSVIRIDERHFMAFLCDGMGSGKAAGDLSTVAIGLLESFYKAGMPSALILETVNKLLTMNVSEGFVCLDIATLDLGEGKCDVVKIGSPMSFVLSGDKVRVLDGESIPLGILSRLQPSTAQCTVRNGDILVLISDGISEAFEGSSELFAFLQSLSPRNPQALAEQILNEALSHTQCKANDDLTVLCVRIFERN